MDESSQKQTLAPTLKQRFFSLPTLLSFGIAGAFILFLVTSFELDWSSTWANIRSMNPWLYALAILSYYISFLLRGLRWRLLARNTGALDSPSTRLPSAVHAAQLIVIAWFINAIMWMRLGDAYRAYAFAREARGSFSWSLGTLLAERVLDIATVLAIIIFSTIFLTLGGNSSISGYMIGAATGIVVVLLAVLLVMRMYGSRLAQFLPNKLEMAYNRFHQGTLGSFKQLPTLVLLGFGGWLMEIGRMYFVLEALGLSVPWPLIPLVALGHALLSIVPTPGGIGVVEPGITGLLLLSLERHDAVSVTLVDRSITYLSVITVGGLVFLVQQVIQAKAIPNYEEKAFLQKQE